MENQAIMTGIIKSIIFDLDGVIADTLPLHYRAWTRLAQEMGVRFSMSDFEAMRGLSREASIDQLLGKKIAQPLKQTYLDHKNAYFLEEMETLTPYDVQDGIRLIIADARYAGMNIGVGSASKNTFAVLDKLGMLDQFDAIGDGLMFQQTKPQPHVYLWVAGRLGSLPQETLIFEDSAVGVQAALNGGFFVVGFGNSDGLDNAHFRANHPRNILLEDLVQQIESLVVQS